MSEYLRGVVQVTCRPGWTHAEAPRLNGDPQDRGRPGPAATLLTGCAARVDSRTAAPWRPSLGLDWSARGAITILREPSPGGKQPFLSGFDLIDSGMPFGVLRVDDGSPGRRRAAYEQAHRG
ncbi:hypothetical protein GCM10023235_63780 [Kitasatospora terrestris]|uniref:Uncharacterized protein n=1 Tax=Kitasatospora terrestris TaxID=258051 RepID=A0ABP9EFQ0_9ACTN